MNRNDFLIGKIVERETREGTKLSAIFGPWTNAENFETEYLLHMGRIAAALDLPLSGNLAAAEQKLLSNISALNLRPQIKKDLEDHFSCFHAREVTVWMISALTDSEVLRIPLIGKQKAQEIKHAIKDFMSDSELSDA